MKKLKEEMDRIKIENLTVIRANKKMKEEHDEFMSKNVDLFLATGKLAQAEKELDILKVNMEETQEALRMTRSTERAQQRELITTKAEVKDLKISIEKSRFDLNNAIQEKQQLATHLEKVKEVFEIAEKNLETSTQLNLDLNKRLREMEEENQRLVEKHEIELHEASKQIDQLKYEMKELQHSHKSQIDVKFQLETALTVAQEEIHHLQEIQKSQEIELLESAEEIEQFEEEIQSMQQFIRESRKFYLN
jgi:chromosome segregation ATPase